jgi:hypothetical protein
MNLYLIAPTALTLMWMLSSCSENAARASPESKPTAQSASDKAVDSDLERDIAQLATSATRLHSENGMSNAKIAPNGDLSVRGKAIAIDDTQRDLLVAYRGHLVTVVQAGKELSSRSTDAVTDNLGEIIGGALTGRDRNDPNDALNIASEKMSAAASRICDGLPALISAQNAVAAALPEFKPYAQLTEADAVACQGSTISSRSSSEKIGQTIGAALGNPFSGGLVAGYMTAEAKHSSEDASQSTPTPSSGAAQ